MPSAIRKLQDKEWLREQYVDLMRSANDIAHEVGCDASAVCRALKRHGIEVRNRTSKYAILNDEEWLRQKYIEDGLSTHEIATLIGSTPGNVYAHLVAKGIVLRTIVEGLEAKYPEGRFGETASNWKGGKRKAGSKGYIQVYQPDHPYADQAGYVMEHRLVLEKKLGRYLDPSEDSHHINEDVEDNRPENLMAVSRSEHKLIHSMLRKNKLLKQRIQELEAQLARNEGRRCNAVS